MHGTLEYGYASRSFMFIGASRILVPIITSGDDFDDEATIGLLPVFDCSTTRARRCTYEYALTHYSTTIFHLPAQRRGVDCARLDLFGRPYSAESRDPQIGLGVPFYADPQYQILAFRLWMIKPNDVWKHYSLFVSTETLVRLSHNFSHKANESQRTVHVAWEAWAEETRMTSQIRTMHHAHLSQMRCISVEPPIGQPDRGPSKDVYCLYEFPSKLSIRRDVLQRRVTSAIANGDRYPDESLPNDVLVPTYITYPTIIDHPDVWAQKIETALPFRKTQSHIVVALQDSWQINEDCIVIRSSRPRYVPRLGSRRAVVY
jgi:hypothetical protein